MNIPGFTGELSLNQARGHYQMAMSSHGACESVLPAQMDFEPILDGGSGGGNPCPEGLRGCRNFCNIQFTRNTAEWFWCGLECASRC
jgi:hypothetical protein